MEPDQVITVNEYEDEAKYVVFKLRDWENWVDGLESEWTPPQPVDDAVVIRLKDPYASSALHAYTNAILTVLDIMEGHLNSEEYQQQLDIADYFHQQAITSEKIKNKRLPD